MLEEGEGRDKWVASFLASSLALDLGRDAVSKEPAGDQRRGAPEVLLPPLYMCPGLPSIHDIDKDDLGLLTLLLLPL